MTSPPTSQARRVVLFFAVTLAIITYVDRVCISQAAPAMQAELGLTKIQMGYAFTAFGWAYALFEIPGGWLGDRIGPRKVLMRVVGMWSLFTVATGWAWNLWSLVVSRFFFGMGEAGCFPNITKAFTNWFPSAERVKAQGILWLSARWGGAFTPLLVGWMLASGGEGKFGLGLHYRWVFLIFGLLGVVWALSFYRWFRDYPKNHPSVSAAELAVIGETLHSGDHSMPWGKLLASRTVWMLWAQYFFMSYAWYFYITWFPTYLKEQFTGMGDMQRALLACVPLFFGGIGSILAGLLSARLDVWLGSIARTRRWLGVLGMGAAGLMLSISMQLQTPVASVLAIGLAALFSDLAMPGAWGACMDVGGRHTGALSGSMNMMGQVGGAIAPMAVPLVLAATNNNWTINMGLFAVSYFLGAICWAFINSDERLHE
ncbi:MFS transporter [Prosthecobacter sp.]|uniref:MFS transporter n=1 Tax=Prosthecobacter sp. TaxID=1965333 RepID=UPI0037846181